MNTQKAQRFRVVRSRLRSFGELKSTYYVDMQTKVNVRHACDSLTDKQMSNYGNCYNNMSIYFIKTPARFP